MLTRVRVVSPKKPLGRSGSLTNRNMISAVFFTYFCCKNVMFALKRQKINEKEAGDGPF